ncbi:hypothetical protein C8R44DRAFT_780134 [Mycena epipterygia]|nr:hypothetical protein C8R44DRAFT_780134 [Mycena epipterygia]
MSRRSARLKGVENNPIIEDIQLDSDEDFSEPVDEEEPEFVPKKKRRKAGKSTQVATAEDQKLKKVRGRRGLLSSLKEFPLDVLFEIFGHLNPLDLLHLARTTKEIRGILMARSAAFIWKEARSHVEGLPDLPRDLSEPQYANLVFDCHCHKCLAMPVQTVIWSARTRMCKKCMQENFDTSDNMVSATQIERSLLEFVPSFEDRRTGRRNRWYKTLLYSADLAKKLSEKCAEFRAGGVLQCNDPGYLEWRAQKVIETNELNAHSELCTVWAANRTSNRSNELHDARRLRQEAIVERLTALGWEEEISANIREFNWHKLVRQPKELTDRIWKNIEAPLVEFLTNLKKTRLEIEHTKIIKERRLLAAQVYHKYRETFPPDTVFPPKVDVICNEPFRVVIEDTPVYPEEKVTEESFAAAILQVPQISTDWKRCKVEELVKIMKMVVPNAVEADLDLATTFFMSASYNANEPVGYPRILVHAAASTLRYSDDEGSQSLKWCLGQDSWNGDGTIRIHKRASGIVRSVVEACGLDPDVTTTAEMNEINPVMECLNCSDDTHGRLVMRWIQTTTHPCGEQAKWKCLRWDEEPAVEAEEKVVFERNSRAGYLSYQDIYCCALCDVPKMTFSKLNAHRETAHSMPAVSLQSVKYHIDTNIALLHPRALRLMPPVQEVEVKEAEVVGELDLDSNGQ